MKACQTELDCIYCGHVTEHTLIYASFYIKRIRCSRCHSVLQKSTLTLLWYYSHDLPRRGFALIRRLQGEAWKHPFSFALSLPKRIVYKPVEVVRELADLYIA